MQILDQNKWLQLWRNLEAKGDPLAEFERICSAYSTPPRAYHNLEHIADCLKEFESARKLVKDDNAVELAIWYHDAVYDSKAKDNEERSAEMAVKALHSAGLAEWLIETVEQLILVTKHTALPQDKDTAILVDVDLSILGQPWEKFETYERAIRQEYAWVSEPDFANGRSSILKSFLERRTIYTSDLFRNKYEAQARENISRSLELLLKKR